ncbi:M4 family metallopeptidase [Vibrio wakamikoensis]|uniref:M4 family metallopeptidase n=1 Tax=Vibrio wakamikoensis TaxID=2910251 RepID=UPI003D19CC94
MNHVTRQARWLIGTSTAVMALSVNAAEFVEMTDATKAQALIEAQFSIAPQVDAYTEVKRVTLLNGKTKVKYQQLYQGLPVYDATITSTKGEQGISEVYGVMAQGLASDLPVVKPNISSDEALQLAERHHFSLHPSFVDTKPEVENRKSKLMVRVGEDQVARMVYLVDFFVAGDEPERPFMFVDAESGDILESWDGINHAMATGPGGNEKTGAYYFGQDFPSILMSKSGNTCTMSNSNVKTVNLNGSTSGSSAFSYTCNDSTNYNDYKTVNGAYSPINDAQYFGNVVFDMFKDWMQTAPLTFQLTMRVHYGNNYENAFWNGSSMTFGDGKNTFYPLVDINVSAHEVSHGFTEQNSGLVYKNMSGGMNEAYSDIAGEAAEYYMRGSVDWLVGADIFKGNGGLRYFDQPSKDGKSIDNASQYYDGLNVHYSSGVFNRAFYLLSTKYNWDIKSGFQVFTLANQMYWGANSTFDQGGCGVAKAADDLSFKRSDVVNAFAEVGVDASCGTTTPTPGNELVMGQPVTELSGSYNSTDYYTFSVDTDKMVTVAITGGTGDADLYVKKGAKPTTSDFDCRPYRDGNVESCSVSAVANTTYHVMLRGYRAYSNVTLSLN